MSQLKTIRLTGGTKHERIEKADRYHIGGTRLVRMIGANRIGSEPEDLSNR